MSKRWTESDWYMPGDLIFQLGNVVMIVAMVVMLTILDGARRAISGDPTVIYAAGAAGFLGVVLLAVARWPLYKQRKILAVGPKHLSGIYKKLYWIAYLLIGTSIVTMLVLILALK